MHNTLRDVAADKDQAESLGVPVGAHILTTTLEGDGAVELASDKAKFEAKIISIQRTSSGGIQIQNAVWVNEPAPEVVKQSTPEEAAVAYFVGKGFSASDAAAQVGKFGADRVLSQAAKENAQKQQDLDKELEAVLAAAPPQPASPAVN